MEEEFMAKRLALFLMIGVLVLGVLAACGGATGGEGGETGGEGGGGEGAVEEAAEGVTGGGETLQVSATEMAFTPSTLEAPANSTVEVEVTNDGTMAHDFTIDADGSGEMVQAVVEPGATETATVKTGAAGTLTFYCRVPGHRAAGMEGTINVS
jgi:uncharacterized cupredoxin-like copper-binding protein